MQCKINIRIFLCRGSQFAPGYNEQPQPQVAGVAGRMDIPGGVHDLFSDMHRHTGDMARSLPSHQLDSGANPYGQYQQTQPHSLYPSSAYGSQANEPSSPGTMGNLFSAAGLGSGRGTDPYGGSYANGNNDDYTQYHYGRPIEAAASSGPYVMDNQGSDQFEAYGNYSVSDNYGTVDPYTQTGSVGYGPYGTQPGTIPDPPAYSSLAGQFSQHSSAPTTPHGQGYQNEQPTYPYMITSPDREQPEFTYRPMTSTAPGETVSNPFNQSANPSEIEMPDMSTGPISGQPTQSWDDEQESSYSAGLPPTEPPPLPPLDEPPQEEEDPLAGTAHGYTDPSIPPPPPLPPMYGAPGAPPPPAPPLPPPLPTTKASGPAGSTAKIDPKKNEDQVIYATVWHISVQWKEIFQVDLAFTN